MLVQPSFLDVDQLFQVTNSITRLCPSVNVSRLSICVSIKFIIKSTEDVSFGNWRVCIASNTSHYKQIAAVVSFCPKQGLAYRLIEVDWV